MKIFLINSLFFILLFPELLKANIVLEYSSDSLQTTAIVDSSQFSDSLKIDAIKIKRKINTFLPPTDSIESRNVISVYQIHKKNIDRLDYKFTGNLISVLPFSLLLDLGHTGLPSEPNLFNYGYGNSSININGISFNNRWQNSFNLNNVQTESISSLSLTPLPRGFLYNTINNPVTLNVITSDTLMREPISRIRFYQASSNEGFIDVMFSAKVLSKLATQFRLTNISTGNRYLNTSFATWKANLKTTYKLSDLLYTSIVYNYLKSKTSLNGGVIANVNMYDKTFASIYFDNRYYNTIIHNVQLNLFGKIFKKNLSKINFGYENNINEIIQNIKKPSNDSTRIFNNNSYNLYSMQFEQNINIGELYSKFLARYEFTDFDITKVVNLNEQTNCYTWALLNYNLLNGKIKPSIYGKFLNYGSQTKSGFGLDISAHPISFANFYIGFSSFGKPYSILEKNSLPIEQFAKDQIVSTFLISTTFNYLFTETSVSYFLSEHKNSPIPIFTYSVEHLDIASIIYTFTDNISNQGINILSKNKIGSFLTSININYFLNSSSQFTNSPQYSLVTGLYYTDTLFNSNLDLKTGFTFYLNSNVDYKVYDYQRGQSAKLYLNDNVAQPFTSLQTNNNSNRLDFFLAGRIQDKATFYFTFENIFDNQYYIVPFYPMYPRGIRIGFSWDFIN